ncbi:subtilisin family serine protease [Catalinimonas alkaloidigena]|uniref:S8 family serine peptidase n=1 Tax=Catalinimonas alkaloidigena TaxID=1075417 RepID=UPI002406F7E0|nr:S8 family serine peptidase [Catalinimonas alkaloidigena]MDF9795962.1 subtilisin family serine protease [Catalinimonas alkaloidigena]
MKNAYRHCYVFFIASAILFVSYSHSAVAQAKKGKYHKIDPALLNINDTEGSVSSSSPALQFSPKSQQSPPSNAKTLASTDDAKSKELRPLSHNVKMVLVDGHVAIEAVSIGKTQELLSELKSLGIKNESSFGSMVSGLLPVDKVEQLQGLKYLRFARPTYLKTNIGATTSQGDQVMFSDLAKSKYKITGEGNKIGVLSDSYNTLGGAEAGIQSGDLPGENNPNGYFHPVQVLEDLLPGEGIDEGRAMMEIIHDVAPGAELAFHTAFLGQASFAQGIVDLADEGSDIIVDDVFYFAEPFFQDGIITQAVDIVSDRNVSYFSSAGNSGRDSYEAEFRPVTDEIVLPLQIGEDVFPSTYVFHDFDPGPGEDIFQEIAFDPGSNSFTIAMQWDEPFASVCEGCPGSSSDLDVFIALEEDTETILYDFSSFFGNLDGDPIEFTSFGFNNSEPISLYLLIGKWVDGEAGEAPDPNIIKYISFDGGTIMDDPTFSSTCVGHSNGENTVAVGASFFFNNPLYFSDIDRPIINSYSAFGGTPILFNTKGERIEAQVRNNPDITGPDAGNTTFFFPGLFIGFEVPGTTEPDEFPQFAGTSASAPHVAAVAALMNDINGERLHNTDINKVLMQTATDMDDPFTPEFDEGYDFKTGAGFVNARKAIASVAPLPSVVSFTLINVTTEEEIGELGDRIELSQIEGGMFNIRADVIDGKSSARSVLFELSGDEMMDQIENIEPYALYGDDKHGDYYEGSLPIGQYTLKATPFTESKAEGMEGYDLSVSFEVTLSPVASFTLFDADTDQPVEELEDGTVINLLTTPNLSIVANPEFEDFNGSIVFYLNGELVHTENYAPYAIGGDNKGDLASFDIEPGEYTLTAMTFTEKDGGGMQGSSTSVEFKVVEELEVTALVLVDSDLDQDLIALKDGMIVPLDVSPNVNIKAEVNSSMVNSVEFRVNGEVFNVDNDAPFALGEEEGGDYKALDLPPGEYTITAVPFGREGALGSIGIAHTVFIELENNFAVTDFELWDARNDVSLGTLESGALLDLATLPALSIEALVDDPEDVGSVEFILNDERVAIENYAPYAIGGNDDNDYRPYPFKVGTYILTAIPYSAMGLKGIQGDSLTIFFEVIDSEEDVSTENLRLVAYPNPVASELNLSIEHPSARLSYYAILDNLGRTLSENYVDQLSTVNIDVQPYQSKLGSAKLFYVKVITDRGTVRTFPIKRE